MDTVVVWYGQLLWVVPSLADSFFQITARICEKQQVVSE